MPQSLVRNMIHLTFSTKGRRPFISSDIRPELNQYLAGILRNCESPAVAVRSVADHSHLLFSMSRKRALMAVIEEVKKSSSKWIKTKSEQYADFYWQAGYGAFSVSQSNVDHVRRYVESQEERHREVTFQDEFRALLHRHGIEFDERYVWD
ncbi:MAG: IS200/IS605 family transposase [Planctomycetaceae bacterium]